MTAEELIKHFNTNFKYGEWPKTYKVDRETYENCERYILDWLEERRKKYWDVEWIMVIGPHGGIMLKMVELILEDSKDDLSDSKQL